MPYLSGYDCSNAWATDVTDPKSEIMINRKSIVQSNMALLNSLHQQLTEILAVGKILYKATNPAKLQEYTFSDLKKRVRKISKPENAVSKEPRATNEK